MNNRIGIVYLSIPFAILFSKAIFLVKWNVDVPFMDDWRPYIAEQIGVFGFDTLFHPANDTIYASGKLLDAIAYYTIRSAGVAYQLSTMIIFLGGLLVMYLHLFRRLQLNFIHVPICFAATLFTLQIGGYWGIQDLAYHQIIPVFCLFGAIAVSLQKNVSDSLKCIFISSISVFGGFAYISGAFVATSALITSFLFYSIAHTHRDYFKLNTIGFGIGALLTLPAQLWVILFYQSGRTHIAEVKWSLPWESEFWIFASGIILRAFGVGPGIVEFPFAIIILFLLFTLFLFGPLVMIFFRLLRNGSVRHLSDFVYVVIAFCILSYIFIVTAGRANLGPDPTTPWKYYFINGGHRFHFFWVTILIPWSLFVWLNEIRILLRLMNTHLVFVFVMTPFLTLLSLGKLNFESYFQQLGNEKLTGLNCLITSINDSKDVNCPQIYPGDITNAVHYAITTDTQFADRLNLAISLQDEKISEEGEDINSWVGISLNEDVIIVSNNSSLTKDDNTFVLDGSYDSGLTFDFSNHPRANFENCMKLKIELVLNTKINNEFVQLFYMKPDSASFAESASLREYYVNGLNHKIKFNLANRNGFKPLFRIDGGNSAQIYEFNDLKFYCIYRAN